MAVRSYTKNSSGICHNLPTENYTLKLFLKYLVNEREFHFLNRKFKFSVILYQNEILWFSGALSLDYHLTFTSVKTLIISFYLHLNIFLSK